MLAKLDIIIPVEKIKNKIKSPVRIFFSRLSRLSIKISLQAKGTQNTDPAMHNFSMLMFHLTGLKIYKIQMLTIHRIEKGDPKQE